MLSKSIPKSVEDTMRDGSGGKEHGHLPKTGRHSHRAGKWLVLLEEVDRRYEILRVAKFGVATGAGFLVVEAILVVGMLLFYHTTQVPSVAFSSSTLLGLTALAFGVGATVAFLVNERVAFKNKSKKSRRARSSWLARWGRYQLAALFGNAVIVVIQLSLLATISLSPASGHIIGSIVTYPLSYVISSHFVWGVSPFARGIA